jgi:energy-coupling factor transport system ATP-binding protein
MTAAVDVRELFRIHRTAEGDAAALQGLTLRIDEGELVAVLGPSGAGKSTLLRILAALERPSAGSARVLGVEVGTLRSRGAATFRARRLGMVDQHYGRALSPDLTCAEIVEQGLALLGAEPAARRLRAAELLERVGLPDVASALPGDLSGGEQQRVAVCAAVAHRPKLLLADEPGGELDAVSAHSVYALIADLAREEGTTVLMVSHDPATSAVVDRSVQIRDGRLSDERLRDGGAAIVVGRGGWLRVPEELLRASGIGERAQAEIQDGGVMLRPSGELFKQVPGTVLNNRETSHMAIEQPPAAELSAVEKVYGSGRRRRVVLRGLDARFERERLTVVTGRSGVGKSTVLRLLGGLEPADAGTVTVLGTQLGGLGRAGLAELRRRHIAIVGQEPDLVGFLGAAENISLGLSLRGIPPGEAAERAALWLGRLGLEPRAGQRVSRLSAGERQRVALARALAAETELVLVDEPTSRLDQANAALVGRLLADACRLHGATIVCSTHEPLLIEAADAELPLEGAGAPLPVPQAFGGGGVGE